MRRARTIAALAVLACAAAVGGSPPDLRPTQVGVCRAEGGCTYVSKDWLAKRMAEAREAGRREAKTQCGERTGLIGITL